MKQEYDMIGWWFHIWVAWFSGSVWDFKCQRRPPRWCGKVVETLSTLAPKLDIQYHTLLGTNNISLTMALLKMKGDPFSNESLSGIYVEFQGL